MHLNSELIFKKYAKRYFHEHMRVLEIGPNAIPSTYCQTVGKQSIVWETLDIADDGKLTYVAENEYKFPVPDGTFDIVLSGQVIEHVRKIWVWVKELARVCKKGGKVIIIAPISWTYHKAPIDCWRIYPDGMQALYEDADLAMDLCTMESLEYKGKRTIIPGVTSRECKTKGFSGKIILKEMLKWPVTVALDTIAIGTKIK